MKNLEQRLQTASGYLELGMFQEANDELEALPPELEDSRQVLELRAEIYQRTDAWELLRGVGGCLVHHWPEEAQHWIWLACGTRLCRSMPEAEQILVNALRLHDAKPMIHYNLACYAAQSGNLDLARERLIRAFDLEPDARIMALDDPDLKPLWGEL